MRIGVGGGIGPFSGGISNKGAGIGVGPFSVGGSFSGGGSILGVLLMFAALLFALFWPMVLVLELSGQADQEEVSTWVVVLAWLAEGVYALVVAWWWFFRFENPASIWQRWMSPAMTSVAPKVSPQELADSYLEIAGFYEEYLKAWKGIADDPADEAQYLDLEEIELWALRRGGVDLDHLDTGTLQVWGDSVRFEGSERDLRLDMSKLDDVYIEDGLVVAQMVGRRTFEAFGGLETYLPLIEASLLWAYGGDDRATAKKVMKEAIKDFKAKAAALVPAKPTGDAPAAISGAQCQNGHAMNARDSKCGECGARLRIQWMEH